MLVLNKLKTMDWSKGKILKSIGLDPSEYYDGLLTAVFNKPMFDLNKFEDWLYEKFPNDKTMSIKEICEKHFPKEAKEIEELFTI